MSSGVVFTSAFLRQILKLSKRYRNDFNPYDQTYPGSDLYARKLFQIIIYQAIAASLCRLTTYVFEVAMHQTFFVQAPVNVKGRL